MKYVHGGDIYTNEYKLDFSANIAPFGCNEAVRQAAADSLQRIDAYPDPQCRRLKQKIVEKWILDSKNLVIGNGAADVLFSLVLAEKPKRGMILAPAFQEYEQALNSVDSHVIIYKRSSGCRFELGEDFLECLKDEGKKGLDMLFFCTPDNPVGALIPREILEKALAICEEYHIRMVVDESFWEFAYEESSETMLPSVSDHKQLFLLRSFTKMYGMPGLRLGCGICSDQNLIAQMEEIRQPWSVSIPAQEAGIAALDEDVWVRRVRDYVRSQREWLKEELKKLGCRVYPSVANYLLFYVEKDLMVPLKERGILIRDCSNYRSLEKGYYRIAVKEEKENRQLINALQEILLQEE